MDGPTNQRSDRQTLLQRCVPGLTDASWNAKYENVRPAEQAGLLRDVNRVSCARIGDIICWIDYSVQDFWWSKSRSSSSSAVLSWRKVNLVLLLASSPILHIQCCVQKNDVKKCTRSFYCWFSRGQLRLRVPLWWSSNEKEGLTQSLILRFAWTQKNAFWRKKVKFVPTIIMLSFVV